ncbi:uncharacterized protein [Henckelia pumila]|uniref:uncharacterized protein n=1 Tax=Henckelia pumila TaxID=405737 RepID=UPI003C6E7783
MPSYITQEIIKLLIPRFGLSNKRFWKFKAKSQYSMKSGYRVGSGLHNPPANQSDSVIMKNWWNFIWSLTIPPKIWIFWWRVFHNIIPTMMNLRKHHVPVFGWCCPLCHTYADSTCHSLFYCSKVKKFQKECGGMGESQEVWKPEYSRDLYVFVVHLERGELEEFVCRAWVVWGARCKAVHSIDNQESILYPTNTIFLLNDYRQAMSELAKPRAIEERSSPTLWEKPTANWHRIDVDASFNKAITQCGLGGVIRNQNGHVVVAFGKAVKIPDSIVLGELLARVCVFSDSLLAVQAVTEPFNDLSYVGSCALEIR